LGDVCQVPEKTIRFTESLKCDLSREEIEAAGGDLARSIQEVGIIEEERKSVNDQYKARIASKDSDISRFAALVRNKYEFRQVDCTLTYDFIRCLVTKVRTDTGEILEERAMRDSERQMGLPIESNDAEEDSVE
jgi:hypothetical protein